jgi:WD40 repeat protein
MRDDTEEVVLKGHYLPAFLPADVLLTAVVPKEGVPPWGHTDCLIRQRKLGRKEEPETLYSGAMGISAVACAPDGRTVALGSYGEVRILSLPDKQIVKVGGHKFGSVRSLAFSPDAKRLAVVNEYSRTWLIDIGSGTGQSRVIPLGHGGPVAFAPDGCFLIVGSEAVQLRDLTGQAVRVLLQVFPWTKKPEWVAFTPLGYFKRSDGAGAFLRWQVRGESVPFEAYAEAYDRPEVVSGALGCRQ